MRGLPGRAPRNAMRIGLLLMALLSGPALAGPEDLRALDRAAKEVLDDLQPRSIALNSEYCGFLLRDADGGLSATKIRRGSESGCTLPMLRPDQKAVATFHTHSAYSRLADSEMPSVMDLESDMEADLVGYIATPGGRLWRSNAPKGMVVLLCGPGCLTTDQAYEREADDPDRLRYTLKALKHRQGGAPWNERR